MWIEPKANVLLKYNTKTLINTFIENEEFVGKFFHNNTQNRKNSEEETMITR